LWFWQTVRERQVIRRTVNLLENSFSTGDAKAFFRGNRGEMEKDSPRAIEFPRLAREIPTAENATGLTAKNTKNTKPEV
jgi:hypothetical protein